MSCLFLVVATQLGNASIASTITINSHNHGKSCDKSNAELETGPNQRVQPYKAWLPGTGLLC